jgi:hypothetical protein
MIKRAPLLKVLPATELVAKDLIIHIRVNEDWKRKLAFLSEHDTAKNGKFISISAVIRGAIQKMFSDRQHTLYPDTEGGGEAADPSGAKR